MNKNNELSKKEVKSILIGMLMGLCLGIIGNLFATAAYDEITARLIPKEWVLFISGIMTIVLIVYMSKLLKINKF